MNKFFISAFLLVCSLSSVAQSVKVYSQSEKLKSDKITVHAVTLEGKKDEVSNAWNKYLKEIGKLKQNSDPMILSEAKVGGATYSGNNFYAGFRKVNETSSSVWIGINPAEWPDSKVKGIDDDLEKLIYQFGIKFYRDQVQVQINETQEALDAVEKQKLRAINQNKDLTLKLSNNEQEKIQLEKSLENNTLENAVLKVKLENNKKAQDSLLNVSNQIFKVMEQHKEKQRKIN
jgi:hypothetical protein